MCICDAIKMLFLNTDYDHYQFSSVILWHFLSKPLLFINLRQKFKLQTALNSVFFLLLALHEVRESGYP